MLGRKLKTISFCLLGMTIIMLIAATVLEKMYGSSFAYEHIYTSPFSIALWSLLALNGSIYLISCRTWKQFFTFSLHLSFVLILAGALITHIIGKQGRMHIRTGEAISAYETADGVREALPFMVTLEEFKLEYYAGTSAPMDYISHINIQDGGKISDAVVSMNNIHKYRGYRFYQSGFDRDGKGATLAVSYDPWGIGITYAGYIALLVSMLGFFCQKGSRFRQLLKHPSLKKAMLVLLISGSVSGISQAAETHPRTLSKEAAAAFGDLYVYHNDRICPLQTLARDFTAKIYGKTSYKGLTAEQVLTGWFFFYDYWKNEPMIKIKGGDARGLLDIDGKYASLTDFADRNGYKLEEALQNQEGNNIKNIYSANEKFNLISMLCTGTLLKIYPYTSEGGELGWYSLADRLQGDMPYEEWAFVTGSMNYVAEKVAMKDDAQIISLLEKIREYQIKKAGAVLPSEMMFKSEKIYNSTNWNKPLAMFCMTLGIIAFLVLCLSERRYRWLKIALSVVCACIFAYLTFHIGLRWYISGHVPLSNGFETMQFMAWCCILLAFCLQKRFIFALPFGILVCGFALLVSMMGEANPRITQLMPVLQSPLLSVHVMVIMISYTLFAFMMLNGVAALISRDRDRMEYLKTVSNIMLYPALFLLTAGIFIGAVWANVSWGRYWGWDPKEVWALITMLIYSLGIHQGSLKWFRDPKHFHIFCILAFLSVLITYFGVNFLLGGLHSYA